MFVLNCDITIGQYRFTSVHQVKVKRSLHSYVDTAVVKIPASARLKQEGQVTSSQETAKLIQEKMPVLIKLGYNGELHEEFSGYVGRVNFTTPVEIECEGHFQPLKYLQFTKSWENTTLLEVLQYLVTGTDIALSSRIPDAPLGKVYIDNQSGTEVLDMLKKWGFAVYFNGRELYAGLQYVEKPVGKEVRYRLGWNVIRDNQLKYRRAEDVKVKLIARTRNQENMIVSTTVGDKNGMERVIEYPYANVVGKTTAEIEANLKEKAESDLKGISYDGYEGKITTFLVPFALPNDTAKLEDPQYGERDGAYIVESTEVTFGTTGARRVLEIGIKVNAQK